MVIILFYLRTMLLIIGYSLIGEMLIVNPKVKWIKKNRWWLHNESEPMYFKPHKQYDAIFFIKESKAATRLSF